MRKQIVGFWAAWSGCCLAWTAAEPLAINESARQIPVAQSVDVAVVGGSTGAVAAAVAASKAGAKVFLAAPHAYLGDDLTATLRLWLDEGEVPASPLAKKLFEDSQDPANLPDPSALPFTYEADRPAGERHLDTVPPSRLSDQVWEIASRDSVQFDGDVHITVDLGESRDVDSVRVRAFRAGNFRIETVTVSSSEDRKTWKPVSEMKTAEGDRSEKTVLSSSLGLRTRYLRFFFPKPAGAGRMLLGEIEVIGPRSEAMRQALSRKPWPRPMHLKRTLDGASFAIERSSPSWVEDAFASARSSRTHASSCGLRP